MLTGILLTCLATIPMHQISHGPCRQLIFWDLPRLHQAALDGKLNTLKNLIRCNERLIRNYTNIFDEGGCTPLHYAIKSEKLAIIRELLAHGATLNMPQANGVPIADIAQNHPTVAWYINEVAPRIPTFLQDLAAGNIANVQALLQWRTADGHHGIDINTTRPGSLSPLHYAVINAGNDQNSPWINVIRTLIARHANINTQDANGNTPLHHAIGNSNAILARYLITHGADLSIKNNNGTMAFEVNANFVIHHLLDTQN